MFDFGGMSSLPAHPSHKNKGVARMGHPLSGLPRRPSVPEPRWGARDGNHLARYGNLINDYRAATGGDTMVSAGWGFGGMAEKAPAADNPNMSRIEIRGS